LEALGVQLPVPGTPKGNFKLAVRTGNYIYLAGHLPQPVGGDLMRGKVGKDLTDDEGYKAAKLCAINLLGTLKGEEKSVVSGYSGGNG